VILFPAIDLKNGQCVRLEQGRHGGRATVFNLDPAAQAKSFAAQGFEYLHVVDLDGAFAGQPMNAHAVEAMLQAVTMPVQLGGGNPRSQDGRGLARQGRGAGSSSARRRCAILKLVKSAARRKFPGRVAVGLDARDGKVAVQGWAETSQVTVLEIAERFEDGRRRRDHLHRHRPRWSAQGPQSRRDPWRWLTASRSPSLPRGGLASNRRRQGDADAARRKKLAGAIAGRALYDGRLDPSAALALIRDARAAA